MKCPYCERELPAKINNGICPYCKAAPIKQENIKIEISKEEK